MNYTPKPLFIERIKKLLRNEEDVEKFFESAKTKPKKAFRANTLKISSGELINRLNEYDWKIKQPFLKYPEVMIVESELEPGELGKSVEHIFGYYYIQEITSMMPILTLQLSSEDTFLDLCASPGSKTTEAAAFMKNKGLIIANDLNIGRITILSANLERCGVTNTIITRHDGLELCRRLGKLNFKFDKILVDAPCSGEGNLRTSPRTLLEWSEGMLERFGKKQKKLAGSAISLLKDRGEMVYSTCTYAPEENEFVIQYLLDNFDIEILDIDLPIKARPGISEWKGRKLSSEIKKCARIYHHDNDMEGFFVCKIRKLSDEIKENSKR